MDLLTSAGCSLPLVIPLNFVCLNRFSFSIEYKQKKTESKAEMHGMRSTYDFG